MAQQSDGVDHWLGGGDNDLWCWCRCGKPWVDEEGGKLITWAAAPPKAVGKAALTSSLGMLLAGFAGTGGAGWAEWAARDGRKRRTLNFLTATTSLVSLLRHLSTTPYAPSPTTPITSYLFMAAAYAPLRTVHAPSPTRQRSCCLDANVGPRPMLGSSTSRSGRVRRRNADA